jgi:transposase-like protein
MSIPADDPEARAHAKHMLAKALRNPRQRWTVAMKAEICRQIEAGKMLAKDACETYGLHPEEVRDWMAAMERERAPRVGASHAFRRQAMAA